MEKARGIHIDPFAVTGILVILAAAYTYYNAYLNRDFLVFTDEEQIGEVIQSEFPLFVDYL